MKPFNDGLSEYWTTLWVHTHLQAQLILPRRPLTRAPWCWTARTRRQPHLLRHLVTEPSTTSYRHRSYFHHLRRALRSPMVAQQNALAVQLSMAPLSSRSRLRDEHIGSFSSGHHTIAYLRCTRSTSQHRRHNSQDRFALYLLIHLSRASSRALLF